MPRAGVLTLAALLAVAAVPVSAATGDLPNLGPHVTVARMPSGGTVIVNPSAGAPVAAIELWYRAPASGFDTKAAPSIARLAAQAVAASKPLVGSSLGATVKDLGGRLNITVYSDSLAIAAVVPASHAKDVVRIMTTAYFAPVMSDAGFKIAQRDVAEEALVESYNPESMMRDAVFASLFASGPQHYPILGGPKDVMGLSIGAARSYAVRAFRSQNAVLIVSGAVGSSIAAAAVTGRPAAAGSALAAAEGHAALQVASSFEPVAKSFDQPAGGYGWAGPPIANEREATALDFIADFLFRPDTGYVTHDLAEHQPDALVLGQFITLHEPGVLFIAFSGKSVDAVRAKVDEGIGLVRKPLPATTFANALEAFQFHILSDLATPEHMADNFGWYSLEGNPEYAPGANGDAGAYAHAVASLTPEFVAGVAEKYLGKPPASVVMMPAQKAPEGK